MAEFTVTDKRGSGRRLSSSPLVTSNLNEEMSRLRKSGHALPYSQTEARREAQNIKASVNNRTLTQEMRRSRARTASTIGTGSGGSNLQVAVPKVRKPMSSLADKDIPYDVNDLESLQEVRRWARLFYTTHDLVPLLVDIYAEFPVTGFTIESKDPEIKDFYESMFFDTLDYDVFLQDLGREYWISGEVTSLAHFSEELGVWSSEEILNPDTIRVSKSIFQKEERIQLLVKDVVERLKSSSMGDPNMTESERLERNWEYCCVPGTKVLNSELEWVPVETLELGDKIVGFDEFPESGAGQKGKRRWRDAEVTATSIITAPTYEIKTSGPSVTCTDEHRWLVQRVSTGETRVIGALTEDQPESPARVRKYCYTCSEVFESYKCDQLARCADCRKGGRSGIVRSGRDRKSTQGFEWVRTEDLRPGDKIRYVGEWEVGDSSDTGYVAGILDGEGWFSPKEFQLGFAQKPGAVLDKTVSILEGHGFRLSRGVDPKNQVVTILIKGGVPEIMRCLGIFRPVRLLPKFYASLDGKYFPRVQCVDVISVEERGVQEVVALGTSTKTLMAEGMFSHNTQLQKYYPEMIQAADRGDGLDLADALVSRIVNRSSPWDLYGTPHMLRSFRTLMMEESLNAAQDAVSDRLYSPFILATLGVPNLGDGEAWIPTPDDLDDARDDMQQALAADFRLMVHNFGLDVKSVFGRESVPRFDQDYSRIEEKLLQAWGIGKALISGGTGGSGTYASSAINREFVTQKMTAYQNRIRKHILKRAEVIAEAQEHYDYELSGGIRKPIYREIIDVDEETGEEYIRKVPKLLLPEIKFSTLNLRDEAQERQFLQTLKNSGVPVSDGALSVNIPISFEQELEKQSEESVQKYLAQAQAMEKAAKTLRDHGLPLPPELAEFMSAQEKLRVEEEAVKQIGEEMDQGKIHPSDALSQIGGGGSGVTDTDNNPLTTTGPGGEATQALDGLQHPDTSGNPTGGTPGGAIPGSEEATTVELPRNQTRPAESDEMRSTQPVAARSKLTDNPSSYGFAQKVDHKRVANRVTGESIETLSDLLSNEMVFSSLNLLVDEREALLDFYKNEFRTSSRDDTRIADLEDIIEQYDAVYGVRLEWQGEE